MSLLETATRISIAEANERGVDALVGEVENGQEFVVLRDDKPVAVVVSGDLFEQWQQLQDNLIDITLVAARMLTSDGRRYSLDEVLELFGYTREELSEMPDDRTQAVDHQLDDRALLGERVKLNSGQPQINELESSAASTCEALVSTGRSNPPFRPCKGRGVKAIRVLNIDSHGNFVAEVVVSLCGSHR